MKLYEILMIIAICVLGTILAVDIYQNKHKPTPDIKWLVGTTNIIPHIELAGTTNIVSKIEFGLRNDGVVVWHELAK